MKTVDFLRENARWLAAGMLLTWSSAFGQTYFIALSAGHLRETFGLSHGGWGLIYTIGTLCSAAVLLNVGHLADSLRIRTLAAFVIAGFAAMCLAMATVWHWLVLIPIIFGLRLCGQGMMSHLALTAMGRWFRAQRGRAISMASLGFAIAEAMWPVLFVLAAGWIGWRQCWVAAAAILAFVVAPLTMALLRQERTPQSMAVAEDTAGLGGRHWQRRDVLGHWLIWALLPGVLAPPFMVTALFFHQIQLAAVKGWPLAAYVALYPFYSLLTVTTNLACGAAIDRFGSSRILPIYLLPMALGFTLFALSDDFAMAPFALALVGASQGCAQTLLGALWPEYYGTRYLGAVRAMIVSTLVMSTAIGPGLTGWLIDLGIGLEQQCLWMAVYLIVASLFFLFVGKAAERLRGNSAKV